MTVTRVETGNSGPAVFPRNPPSLNSREGSGEAVFPRGRRPGAEALIERGEIAPDSAGISQASRLKWLTALYRPAVPERNVGGEDSRRGFQQICLLGRSQAVRQRILIPPFGGSIPPAPAT